MTKRTLIIEYSIIGINFMSVRKIPRAITKQDNKRQNGMGVHPLGC